MNDEVDTFILLGIESRDVTNYWLYRSEEAARAGLYDYVEQEWRNETDLPTDHNEAIEDYFAQTDEESWIIQELTVQN